MIVDDLKSLAVPIDSLVLDPSNARKHSERNIEAISNSLRLFGQRRAIVVQRNGMIVRAGNGTLQAARKLGWTEIAAVVVDDDNTTAAQYAIADNRTAELAEWDTDALSSLLDQWEEDVQRQIGFDEGDLEALLGEVEEEASSLGEQYSRKIQAPIYEPKGNKPKIADLYDRIVTDKLQDKIQQQDLPDDIRQFLMAASERHTAFHFARIAEFYCHASEEVQRLMEESALVVIDFNQAIEQGYVQLTHRLQELAAREEGDGDA
jgi:hypothetical protein